MALIVGLPDTSKDIYQHNIHNLANFHIKLNDAIAKPDSFTFFSPVYTDKVLELLSFSYIHIKGVT